MDIGVLMFLALVAVAGCACCYGCEMGARENKILAHLEYMIGKFRRRSLEWRQQLDRVVVHRAGCDKRCNERHPNAYKTPCTSHCASCKNVRCKFIAGRSHVTHCNGCTCPYDGCFHGNTLLTLEDGTLRRMVDLRRGDRVWTGSAFVAVCMVTHTTTGGKIDMVQVTEGLWMTPRHPVKMTTKPKWVHPVSVGAATPIETDAVYNLLLEECDTPWVYVNGVLCLTLGHGILDDPVATHDFFGNRAAVEAAYKELLGWEEGQVTVRCDQFMRNSMGYVCGINPA